MATIPRPTDGPASSRGVPHEERDRRIAKNVAEYGWHAMGVAGGDAPGDWGYSIGLWHTLRSPEVSVFGLPSQTAMHVANAAGAAIRDGNALPQDSAAALDSKRRDHRPVDRRRLRSVHGLRSVSCPGCSRALWHGRRLHGAPVRREESPVPDG
ncbi:DUF4262 domain-containing protein [Streptomyces sp. NPDC060031]|uniref:DUF4262 domain-containing protein n=1 Tax=Streptomyces sp. NPDC060031 TaxID=3347043 RepID=UPI0036C896E0